MIKAGVIGVSGYSGELALNLLSNHPEVRVTYVSANTTTGKIENLFPYLDGKLNLSCDQFSLTEALERCDVFFLAVPHTNSMEITPHLLKAHKRVIDLSGDYRFPHHKTYAQWYNVEHKDKDNLKKAVYGLPELYRQKIKKAQLVANPGCYPTAAILALAPIAATRIKDVASIIIDAKSGVTGAGRKTTVGLMFSEVNENLKAYKVLNHQHTPEIELYLSQLAGFAVKVTFVPHLIPMNRGILETIYIQFDHSRPLDRIWDLYKNFYKNEKFIRILAEGHHPETKHVWGTNNCEIGLSRDGRKNILIVVSAIDNLMKGASGQAVQNMNILYGLPETLGLT